MPNSHPLAVSIRPRLGPQPNVYLSLKLPQLLCCLRLDQSSNRRVGGGTGVVGMMDLQRVIHLLGCLLIAVGYRWQLNHAYTIATADHFMLRTGNVAQCS